MRHKASHIGARENVCWSGANNLDINLSRCYILLVIETAAKEQIHYGGNGGAKPRDELAEAIFWPYFIALGSEAG